MEFKKFSDKMFDTAKAVEKALVERMKSLGMEYVNTSDESKDPIYCYDFNESCGVDELVVKAIKVSGESLLVLYDVAQCNYTDKDIEEADEEWEPLFNGNLLGVFTAFNIAEVIDEYL